MMKALKRIVAFTAVILLLISYPLTTYSADLEYLEYYNWENNDLVTETDVNKNSPYGSLFCSFKYYYDKDENSFYTYFAIEESTLDSNNNTVYVYYDFKSNDNEYAFVTDENGLVIDENDYSKEFKTYSSFKYHDDSTGVYINAFDLKLPYGIYNVDVKLYVNSHSYLIKKGITIDASKPTTTKATTTKKPTTKKATTTKKAKTTKGKSSKTTKSKDEDLTAVEETAESTNPFDDSQDETTRPKLTMSDKLSYAFVITAVTGGFLGLMIYSSIMNKKGINKKDDNE